MMTWSREKLREIKGYNKEQFTQFLQDIYNSGYNAGVTAMSHELAKRVDEGIRNTPGIGEKRYNDLITNINKELNKENINE